MLMRDIRPAVQLALLALLAVTACARSSASAPASGVIQLGLARLPLAEMMSADLIAADRAASEASARTDLTTGLTSMMSDSVTMSGAGDGFADGLAAVREWLGRDTLNARSRAEWTPVRSGVSGDGTNGFTFGYLTTHRPDGSRILGKYLSYWVREGGAWRVVAYKRSRRPDGEVSLALRQPAVPARLTTITSDPMVIAAHRESLAQVERDFSRDAQTIGLDRAFTRYGSADAMNMGGPSSAEFVIGNAAIGKAVGRGSPDDSSPVAWGPDHRVIVASSGDLGVTFGFIRFTDGGTQAPIPFFTIWRRESAQGPWRYIAE